jgi:hypothetical protein
MKEQKNQIDLDPESVEELIEALQEVRDFQKENCKTDET